MDKKLVDWVMSSVEEWKEHRNQNYLSNWKKYERIWRGVWAGEDAQRMSERSKFISPALQQAVENSSAEIEEALFGQGGNLFEIEDDLKDENKQDIEIVQAYMKECFERNKIRKAVGDSVLLGALYGTCIGEITTKEVTELVPSTIPLDGLETPLTGVKEEVHVVVNLNPINPQNFIIDPNATSIEDAMGCAIEEFVSAHTVAELVTKGVYRDTEISDDATQDNNIEKSFIETAYDDDKIHLIRYYGLVPRKLLEAQEMDSEMLLGEEEEMTELMEEYGDLVEAIIVIGDGEYLLKAEPNPYLMKDRPVVASQYDSVPGKFWGRGICEKGWNTQAAIDAQIRSHLDSLALTTVPMMGIDATRMPRGFKFEVKPGRSVLTNGNPAEILAPFKFGMTDTSNIETANLFERMLLQATGTADSTLMQTGGAGAGEFSLTLSGIIKKNKRILVNYQENFLIPFVEKAAWRFMQFDPENFPVKDFKFKVSGSLGMLAREVEQMQFINLLKTLGTDSPITPILMASVIKNSSLPNKEQMLQEMLSGQKSVKKSLEQLMKEMDASGGNKLGDLDGIAQEMDKVIDDLEKNDFKKQTHKRQQKILTRMLDSKTSMTQRGEKEERKSFSANSGNIFDGPSGLPIEKGQREDLTLKALNNAIKAGYSKQYQGMIKRYFNSLTKTDLDNEN